MEDLTSTGDRTGITNVTDAVNGRTIAYTYDAVGNRRTETANGTTHYYCYHATDCSQGPSGNRLINIRTGSLTGPLWRQFTYDDSGRILQKQTGAGAPIYSVSYNGKGRASQISGTQTHAFAYDPNDYRIQKDSNLYHLEGEHLEATYGSTGVLQNKYLRGVVVDEIVNGYTYHSSNPNDWMNYTFHHDHLNSVTALTGHAGSTEETTKYDAFGAPLNLTLPGTGNDLLYTGREYDRGTGLYYYRARYYDPEIGRFISEDPLGFQAGINFYVYVNNNPINFNDPSGNEVARVSVSGSLFGLNGSAGLFLSFPGPGDNDKFDIGGFVTGEPPSLPANLILEAIDPDNPINDMSIGFGTARLTLDAGWEASRSALDGLNITAYGGVGVPGWGGSLSWNVPGGAPQMSDLIPSGAEVNYGIQGVPILPFNIGIQADYTTSYSLGDAFENVIFPGIDNLTNGWLSGTNAASNGASGGFVLYPNRPNTNMLQTVYSK